MSAPDIQHATHSMNDIHEQPAQEQPAQDFPVFTRRGDASTEVEELIAQLGGSHGDAAAIGLHKYFYVMRVDMTVVLVTGRNTPLAEALRTRQGWSEPKEEH